jgi:hypothetical protein
VHAPDESAGSTAQAPSRHPRLAGSVASPEDSRTNASLPWSTSNIELEYPTRFEHPPSWLGHVPFAFWLVGALRPRTIVELGVHAGNSYCAFLQAAKLLRVNARCFGIDHWRGDEQASFYGEEVYEKLRAFHDPLYSSFSNLLRSSFDDALPCFGDGTVDLLHIDGLHTYEAISHDFENWLPKMSSHGIVLMHDTNVHEHEFGVWQLFAETAARFPTFEFLHSHGLGVAYVGKERLPAQLQTLFRSATDTEAASIRNYFARLGTSVLDRYALHEAEDAEDKLQALKAEVARLEGLLLANDERRKLELELRLARHIKSDRDAARSMLDQQIRLASRWQREVMELSGKLARSSRSQSWAASLVMRPLQALAVRLRSFRS